MNLGDVLWFRLETSSCPRRTHCRPRSAHLTLRSARANTLRHLHGEAESTTPPVPQILMQEQSSCISWHLAHLLFLKMSHALLHEVLVLDLVFDVFASRIIVVITPCAPGRLACRRPNRQHWFLSTHLVVLDHVRVARSRRLYRAARNKRFFRVAHSKRLSHCLIWALLGRRKLLLPQTVRSPCRQRLAAPSHTSSAGPHCRSSNQSQWSATMPRSNPVSTAESPNRFLQNNSATFKFAEVTPSDMGITVISLMHISDASACSSIAPSGSPPSSGPRFLDGGTPSDRLLTSADTSGPPTGVLPSPGLTQPLQAMPGPPELPKLLRPMLLARVVPPPLRSLCWPASSHITAALMRSRHSLP